MKKIILILLFISLESEACRPRADYVAPTLAENVKSASTIFLAKLISKKELGPSKNPFGTKYQLEFQVGKNLQRNRE